MRISDASTNHVPLLLLCVFCACRGTGPTPDGGTATLCGNGVLDTSEQCEKSSECGRRARCTESCACAQLAQVPANTSQVLIDDAWRAGTLSEGTALLYRAYVLFQDPRLPEAFDGIGTDGEDLTLFADIQAAWPRLTTPEQARLKPFMVRPSDPTSVFSTAYTYEISGGLQERDPCNTTDVCAGWKSNVGANFRVWSCGDDLAAERAAILADGEALWGPMTTYMGDPVPDTEDNADVGSPKIDVYIVEPNQARLRGGTCKTIAGIAKGQAIQTASFIQGPEPISSGYLFLSVATATGGQRRQILEHEFFHIQQFAHSTIAVGSWLAESTAAWSERNFLKDEVVNETVYGRFVEKQNEVGNGFLSRINIPLDTQTGGADTATISYEAFIWHYFSEQQLGARAVGDVWAKVATGGYRKMDYTQAVDSTLPFAGNFSKFIVRNLNITAVEEAGQKTYRELDRKFPHNTTISKMDKKGELGADTKMVGSVSLDRLAAQYLQLTVNENAREVTFDFTDVEGGDKVDIELLLKTTPGTALGGWKLRSLAGNRKLVICRDGGDEPVYEAYVALGNHEWKETPPLTGTYKITGRPFCCPPGKTCWVGTTTVRNMASAPTGSVDSLIEAKVMWTNDPAAMFPGSLTPKGTATFSGTATFVNGCTATLAPTTRTISGQGLLMFMGSTYYALGSGIDGDGLLDYQYHCMGGTSSLPSEAKPWLQMMDFAAVKPPGNVLEGTYVPGDGNSYSWHFELQ